MKILSHLTKGRGRGCSFKATVPNDFGTGTRFVEAVFPWTEGRVGGDSLGMIQKHYSFCALYFYYSYISFSSDHQILDTGGWGPLLQRKVGKKVEMILRWLLSFSQFGVKRLRDLI